LFRARKGPEALAHYSAVLELQPDHSESHFQSAVILKAFNKPAEAVSHLRAALVLKSDWVDPLNSLAWIYATQKSALYRDADEAIRLATRAVEITKTNDPVVLDTLAAAYAQNGEFDRAVSTAEKALALSSKQEQLAEQIRGRLKLYQVNKPFRE
jgi:tetratricopeptide (TPR) repeat protein